MHMVKNKNESVDVNGIKLKIYNVAEINSRHFSKKNQI